MSLEKIIYDRWLSKKHPYFENIWTIGVLAIMAFFVFGIISIWALPVYWWKIILTDFGVGVIWWIVGSFMNGIYTDEFIQEMKNK